MVLPIDVKIKTNSLTTSVDDQFLTFVSDSTTTNVQDIKESDIYYTNG